MDAMSRTCERTTLRSFCGLCGAVLAVGDPVFAIAGPGWKKLRCTGCAGESVPASIQEQSAPLRFPSARQLATLARDWKHKQAGDR